MIWLIMCYYFEPWMIPTAMLVYFMKQYILKSLGGTTSIAGEELGDSDLDDDDDDDKDKVML